MDELIMPIAKELNISSKQVENTLKLLEDGNTVPFIARYRKEATNGLDEEQILYIQKQYAYQLNLKQRKEDVIRLIESQGKLTDSITSEIMACTKISQVDDIYRPYQEKKKTRAALAIQMGLDPLADLMVSCPYSFTEKDIKPFLNENVQTKEEAIQGALDIIAERVSDNAKFRWRVKESIEKYGKIVTKIKKDANINVYIVIGRIKNSDSFRVFYF